MSKLDRNTLTTRKKRKQKQQPSQQENLPLTTIKKNELTPDRQTTQITNQSEQNPIYHQYNQQFVIPQIIKYNPQNYNLFNQIHNSNQKYSNHIKNYNYKTYLKKIKQTISYKINQQSQSQLFYHQFNHHHSTHSNKTIKKDYNSLIGQTKQHLNYQQLNDFLMDHRNAIQLQEQAWLTQHYLRTQDQTHSDISYFKQLEMTHRHRRTASTLPQRSQKLFNNSESTYKFLRKSQYQKHDKLMNICIKQSKKNRSYLRMRNILQINYLQQQNKKNLKKTLIIKKNIQQEIIYNIKIKLFLSLAIISDTLHLYYQYINEKSFPKIIQLIIPQSLQQQQQTNINNQYLQQLIQKITKYKPIKTIYFEDFNQILTTLKQEKNYDLIFNITHQPPNPKFSKLLKSPTDTFIQQNYQSIQQLLKHQKIQTIARTIYQTTKNNLIGGQYLPLRDIIELMKTRGFIPHIIAMSKFVYICLWNQMRREGFNQQQFIKIQTYVGLNLNCSLNGLRRYLHSMKLQQFFPK